MTTERRLGIGVQLLGVLVAALVAYYTTQASIQAEIAEIKATQTSQFSEVLRRLGTMQDDIRELRAR
jgi:hypothetical protein